MICHGLACALWLRAVADDVVEAALDRVLLVAPPSPDVRVDGLGGLTLPLRSVVPRGHVARLGLAREVPVDARDPRLPEQPGTLGPATGQPFLSRCAQRGEERTGRGQWSTLTARAMTSRDVTRAATLSTLISSLARLDSGMVSVGLNAVELVTEM